MKRLLEMDEKLYHLDQRPNPSLSYSTASTLVNRSPYHAWLEHPRLGGQGKDATREMDEGTVLHQLILGTEPRYRELGYDDYRTNTAKVARDRAKEEGMIPILSHRLDGLFQCSESVRKQLVELDVVLIGQSEGVVEWNSLDNKNREVMCRARVDHFHYEDAVIYDLKSTTNAHPNACLRKIIDLGYDIQGAAYIQGIQWLFRELVGKLSFKNIFFETEEPYMVCVVNHSESLRSLGLSKWFRAVNLWSDCNHSNHWPKYGEVTLSAPSWAISREMEAE